MEELHKIRELEMGTVSYKRPKVVAEIGCNHMGDFDLACELILLTKHAGAKYVKFQKRNNIELLTSEQYAAPHENPKNSFGKTYGAHREFLEFTLAQHRELKAYCDSLGLIYSTSVWDLTSARELKEINPEFLKVPSACNNNFELLAELRDEFQGQVQLSVGMTTKLEVEKIVEFFEEKNQAKNRLMLYACTSGYPVPDKDVCLLEIKRLYQYYGDRVQEIGFSGHHIGTGIDIAAYTLGANWIERHFTKDKNYKGTDHAASLEPAELKQLCNDLNSAYNALSLKESDILEIEHVQRKKLKNRK